jgi:hypothetical protein
MAVDEDVPAALTQEKLHHADNYLGRSDKGEMRPLRV